MADLITLPEKKSGDTLSANEFNQLVTKTNTAISELNEEKTTRLTKDNELREIIEGAWQGVILPQDGSTAMTRTGGVNAENFWWLSDIALVLLADDLTENEVLCTWANPQIPSDAVLDGSAGQVMVRIPKIYYREIFDETGTLIEVRISKTLLAGFKLHEKFSYGDGKDYIYVGAYEASDNGNNVLQSTSGVAPLTGVDLSTFRSRAFARGYGWYNYDFYTHHLLQLLFYVYYADFDSQTKLPAYSAASGWFSSYKRNTGRSDILTTINGSIEADLSGVDQDLVAAGLTTGKMIANRFLFIENLFGHIWKMMDGVAIDGRVGQPNTTYLTPDHNLFSSADADILSNYLNLNVVLPGAVNVDYLKSLQQLFIPKSFGGNSSSYITDYFYGYLDDPNRNYLRFMLSGGVLNYGDATGVSARYSVYALDNTSPGYGSRLCAAK